ncbi:MAG: hypothetical protein AB1734_03445, partial [Elusimicrobiota bacterium]
LRGQLLNRSLLRGQIHVLSSHIVSFVSILFFLPDYTQSFRDPQLPLNKRKSPLQKCIQILKRHRDIMFKDDSDGKPISIIITTLAALAYEGETELDDTLSGVLQRMENLVRTTVPRVPNPVNPVEDFADKWAKPEYAQYRLEQKLRIWIDQAKTDILALQNSRAVIKRQASSVFGLELSEASLDKIPGLTTSNSTPSPRPHAISSPPPKPWSRG